MTPARPMTPAQHEAAVRAWRAARDERLRSPDGWLALVALHWLTPGENRFGSDPGNEIVLHGDAVPPLVGALWLSDGVARLGDQVLADDLSGEPTMIEIGDLRMHVIRRGERLGLRVRDRHAPALAAFEGVRHFPIDSGWRLEARFEAAPAERRLEIEDVTGAVSHEASRGLVVFERDGATWRIDALPGGEDGTLWLIFGDATNGSETYGGGRYLYTEAVSGDGRVVVDFNLAYNPPCVFSPYATCPLPPSQNRLGLRVDAGELAYGR